MNSEEKQWGRPICVRSSVNVNPAKDFNDFANNLRDEDAEFDRLISQLKESIRRARTK